MKSSFSIDRQEDSFEISGEESHFTRNIVPLSSKYGDYCEEEKSHIKKTQRMMRNQHNQGESRKLCDIKGQGAGNLKDLCLKMRKEIFYMENLIQYSKTLKKQQRIQPSNSLKNKKSSNKWSENNFTEGQFVRFPESAIIDSQILSKPKFSHKINDGSDYSS